ncbi:MAG: hypothetical protein ABJ327_09075 [Litoreibacter sp.]
MKKRPISFRRHLKLFKRHLKICIEEIEKKLSAIAVSFLLNNDLWREIPKDQNAQECNGKPLFEKKFIKGWARKTIRELLSYCLLFPALVWCIYSLNCDFVNLEAEGFDRFVRSGAILVLTGIISEYAYFDRPANWRKPDSHIALLVSTRRLYYIRLYAKNIGYVWIVGGTIVWAYGDWIVEWLSI